MTRKLRRVAAAGLALAAAATLASCSAGAGDGATDAASDAASESPFTPVIDQDFPDPDVLEVDGTYYAYATNGNARNVQVATSTDLDVVGGARRRRAAELPSGSSRARRGRRR